MNPPVLELAQCADEPIRVPGAIQPHGRLVALDLETERPVAFSANWPDRGVLDAALQRLRLVVADLPEAAPPVLLGQVRMDDAIWQAVAHRSRQHVFVEFEPIDTAFGIESILHGLTRGFLPNLQTAASVEDIAELAAQEMKRLTGYGRSLVYRFDEQGHGQVLAERIDPGYDSYANHRFPGSDIPAQARELYLLNRFRAISDANYQPVALVGVGAGFDPRSLDLSFATLRSVSPVHLEYMRNMGTLASLSVSIVVGGRLWGLVSCHNHGPMPLAVQARVACDYLGRLLSMQIEAKVTKADVAAQLELRERTLQIVAHLADSDATLQHLIDESVPLLRLARASGAAVVLDAQCWRVGDTPPEEFIQALAGQVAARGAGTVFASDRVGEDFPGLQARTDAAGLLCISISQVHRHLIFWFRPEIVQAIHWAGDPRKDVRSGDGRLHPRRSFASWKEMVRGRSLPWSPAELTAAQELRQALLGIVLRRAQEMAEVAQELGRANKELEAFSYTVSHDMRAPMRHIAGYVDLVLEAERGKLGATSLRYLGHVKDAAAFAGHLVDALLDFSRMGRAALNQREVDTDMLVGDLVREFSRQEPGQRVDWKVALSLPRLWADPFLLQVVLRNLLDNAVKYSRGRDRPVVEVRPLRAAQGTGLEVVDNGVGFPMQYADKLFGVFQRLHQADEFEGTGIGLAGVRRIVERHGGTVHAHGEVDGGARFGFTLPTQGDAASKTNLETGT